MEEMSKELVDGQIYDLKLSSNRILAPCIHLLFLNVHLCSEFLVKCYSLELE